MIKASEIVALAVLTAGVVLGKSLFIGAGIGMGLYHIHDRYKQYKANK